MNRDTQLIWEAYQPPASVKISYINNIFTRFDHSTDYWELEKILSGVFGKDQVKAWVQEIYNTHGGDDSDEGQNAMDAYHGGHYDILKEIILDELKDKLTNEGREDVDWKAAGEKASHTRKFREEFRKKFPNPKEQSKSFWQNIKPAGSEPTVHGNPLPVGEVPSTSKPIEQPAKSTTTGKVKSPTMVAAGRAAWVTRMKNRVRRLEMGSSGTI